MTDSNSSKYRKGRKPITVRFWEKVEKAPGDQCWLWTAGRNKCGYGKFKLGSDQLAHRVAYELEGGRIPDGAMVLHNCNNGHLGCVRPSHLRIGDAKANSADKIAAGTSSKGSNNGMAKLTEADIPLIRMRADSGQPLKAIADDCGVTVRTVQDVVRGASWSHVPPAR